jgi:hypothetical protein
MAKSKLTNALIESIFVMAILPVAIGFYASMDTANFSTALVGILILIELVIVLGSVNRLYKLWQGGK